MSSLGAVHSPSPWTLSALPLADPSEVGITLSKWGALCTGDKCHDCREGLWLLWLPYERETHSPSVAGAPTLTKTGPPGS